MWSIIDINKSLSHNLQNANLSRLVTSDEVYFEQKSRLNFPPEEDTGYLPPANKVIEGGSDTDGPIIEFERHRVDEMEFLYDSEVGTKFRGTTYYKSKHWTQKEDLHLMSLVQKYKNNWKKISVKLLSKRDPNVEIKNDIDWSRRWTTLHRQKKYEWTAEANDLLLKLVTTKGHNWKLFEKYFEGCDKILIKQQYFKLQKEGRLPTGVGKSTLCFNVTNLMV